MTDRYGQQSTSGPFLREKLLREENERLRKGLHSIIDCPDFSVRRAFSMKQIARAALAQGELPEPGECLMAADSADAAAVRDRAAAPGSESSSDPENR